MILTYMLKHTKHTRTRTNRNMTWMATDNIIIITKNDISFHSIINIHTNIYSDENDEVYAWY